MLLFHFSRARQLFAKSKPARKKCPSRVSSLDLAMIRAVDSYGNSPLTVFNQMSRDGGSLDNLSGMDIARDVCCDKGETWNRV